MRLLPVSLLLSGLLTIASSKPIWPIENPRSRILKAYQSLQDVQQLLLAPPEPQVPRPQRITEPSSPNFRLEAQENSVGVLLTDQEGEVQHFWLPLGRQLYVRDAPSLPLHPLAARITTLINTSPQIAAPEKLDQIQCEVWTHSLLSTRRGKRIEQRSFSFSRQDGLVRFTDEESPFWLRNQEVESYVCS